MHKDLKTLAIIVSCGALWGLVEATLGFVLHQGLATITGLILFPIGFFWMRLGQRSSGWQGAPMAIAAIAALVKLVDLLVPGTPWIKVINPAVAILMEGALVLVFFGGMAASGSVSGWWANAWRAATASFGWRGLYLIYLGVLATFGFKIRLFQTGTMEVVRFLTVDGVANAVLVLGMALGIDCTKAHRLSLGWVQNPIGSVALLAVAVVVTWAL